MAISSKFLVSILPQLSKRQDWPEDSSADLSADLIAALSADLIADLSADFTKINFQAGFLKFSSDKWLLVY